MKALYVLFFVKQHNLIHLKINDDYVFFLLDSPCEKLVDIRKNLKLTRQELANMLNVSLTSVKRWELGHIHISRTLYNK